jgi:hypothetical protein
MRRPLWSESSLWGAFRRIVGGELLCLAKALVSITKIKTGKQLSGLNTHKPRSRPRLPQSFSAQCSAQIEPGHEGYPVPSTVILREIPKIYRG